MLPKKLRKKKRIPGYKPPPLEEFLILEWADAFHQKFGFWPQRGYYHLPIPGVYNEKWSALNHALINGCRGLPGGSSLPRLLAKHRGVRNQKGLPKLTFAKILEWADSFQKSNGFWPTFDMDQQLIPDSHGERWVRVDGALRQGIRGLPGKSSLARLLAKERGLRNIGELEPLNLNQILQWADSNYKEHQRWPRQKNWFEPIPQSNGETWLSVDQALVKGLRGFSGGSSLAQVLSNHRGVRNKGKLPPLNVNQILKWAEAFKAKYGEYPKCRCTPQVIENSDEECWFNIDQALRKGLRGLPGGSSLSQIITLNRGF